MSFNKKIILAVAGLIAVYVIILYLVLIPFTAKLIGLNKDIATGLLTEELERNFKTALRIFGDTNSSTLSK
ncbi:MAG TPA: hypothetical protein PLQ81_08490, partial [bacterium]|nr:hypothetical protein [bacterium]